MIFLDSNNPKQEIQVLPEYTPYVQLDNNASTRDYGTGTPIINQYNGGSSTPTGKVNWWWKAVAAVAATIAPPFGAIAGGIFLAIMDDGNKGAVAPEKSEIDNWAINSFGVFLARITNASAAVLNSGITLANIDTLNIALNHLCIIKTYFAVSNNADNMSEAGNQYRYDMVAELCDKFAQRIADSIAASGLSVALSPVTVNSGNYNFNPALQSIPAGNYNCFNYKASASTGTIQTIKELPVSPPSNVTLPATTTTALQPAGENFVAKNKWLLLAGVFALGWAISPKKKK